MKWRMAVVALVVAGGLAMNVWGADGVNHKRGRLIPVPTPAAADEKPGAKSSLEAKLVIKNNKDATYQMEAGKSGDEFAKKLKEGGLMAEPPAPPKVDMELVITNTGKKMIVIPLGSDSSQMNLTLDGPGAVTVAYMQMHTMEMRLGNPTKIEPGKSLTIPITQLAHGNRGDSMASYWTKAGEYTLTASYVTPVQEGEPKENEEGAEQITTVTAAPVKVQVKEAGK